MCRFISNHLINTDNLSRGNSCNATRIKVKRKIKKEEGQMIMSSTDEEGIYNTPLHLIQRRCRQNVLGHWVPKKRGESRDDDDPEAEGYSLAIIKKDDEEDTSETSETAQVKQNHDSRTFPASILQGRIKRQTAIDIFMLCLFLVVVAIATVLLATANYGNHHESRMCRAKIVT